jgi:hypothetical protein
MIHISGSRKELEKLQRILNAVISSSKTSTVNGSGEIVVSMSAEEQPLTAGSYSMEFAKMKLDSWDRDDWK